MPNKQQEIQKLSTKYVFLNNNPKRIVLGFQAFFFLFSFFSITRWPVKVSKNGSAFPLIWVSTEKRSTVLHAAADIDLPATFHKSLNHCAPQLFSVLNKGTGSELSIRSLKVHVSKSYMSVLMVKFFESSQVFLFKKLYNFF